MLSDVAFVSWNVHVGTADIRGFLEDLRAGTLTGGRRVGHFVLMLQEVVRAEGVPSYRSDARGAARIGGRIAANDIVEISRDLNLFLIYVPSMRNGDSQDDPAADRGSALLSTLPMSEPIAVELPGERQRRVVVIARLAVGADSTAVSVAAIHLDALGAPKRLWGFWTPWMREVQVRSMTPLLPEGTLVLGADLNTWHGKDEPAARLLERMSEETPVSTQRHGLGLRVLDYLFFRSGANRRARYEQIAPSYGSDHRPLIGWLD
jgi:hypothetical protein